MVSVRARAAVETAALFWLTAGFAAGTVLAPPDPTTQLRYLAVTLGVASLVAVGLVYGIGYDRLHLSVRSYAIVWLSMVVTLVSAGVLVGEEYTLSAIIARTAAMLGGVAVGVWLAFHDGIERLRSR